MTAPSLEHMLARLLAAPPEGFLEERKRLSVELKAAGRADEARDLAGRKKPPPAVFAVNRLVGSSTVNELAQTGEAVRVAAQRMLSGGDASAGKALAAAQRAQQTVVRSAAEEGERLLSASGSSVPASARPKIEDTLRALSTLGQVSRIGLLFEEVEPPDMAKIALLLSFSGEATTTPPSSQREVAQAAVEPSVGSGRVISFADSKKLRDERRESERRLSEAKADARATREALDRAKADAQQGRRRAIAAGEEVERKASRVRALTSELAEATAALLASERLHADAEVEVRALEAAVEASDAASRTAADALQSLLDSSSE